jgi:hypothetical protein
MASSANYRASQASSGRRLALASSAKLRLAERRQQRAARGHRHPSWLTQASSQPKLRLAEHHQQTSARGIIQRRQSPSRKLHQATSQTAHLNPPPLGALLMSASAALILCQFSRNPPRSTPPTDSPLQDHFGARDSLALLIFYCFDILLSIAQHF